MEAQSRHPAGRLLPAPPSRLSISRGVTWQRHSRTLPGAPSATAWGEDVLAAKHSGVLLEAESRSPTRADREEGVLRVSPDGVVTPSPPCPKPWNLQAESNTWLWASSQLRGWGGGEKEWGWKFLKT